MNLGTLIIYGKTLNILGVSAFYHDSAAALLINGEIVAAAQEERFSRKKHDSDFPSLAIHECLKIGNINLNQIDAVIYYDKPWLKFERILETYYALAPRGAASFRAGLPVWLKEKAMLPRLIRKHIPKNIPLKFSHHHLSHAASSFYPSPFESAAIMTLDGVGEWSTATIAHGLGKSLKIIRELHFPHSIGLLYSAFTQYCGFKVNSGEYKLMGLAPYGRHGHERIHYYVSQIKTHLCHIFEDGSIWLDQTYFSYTTGLEMVNRHQWERLFGFPIRESEAGLTQEYCDLALAIQIVTEEIVIKMARTARILTGEKNLCLAGGVALNCVANAALLRAKVFDNVWIQPAAGDAGGALGAALAFYFSQTKSERFIKEQDSMRGAYLGPSFDDQTIKKILIENEISFHHFDAESDLTKNVAERISQGEIIGWFQGRMEFGPRALGARSILADPRSPEMQKKLNLKIKFREGFRPFAPSVLSEDLKDYFDGAFHSPYMLLVDTLKPTLCHPWPSDYQEWPLDKRLYYLRSHVPAITHLDYTARVQSVHKETNPLYHSLISEFKKITGLSMVVNTSFNVRGEPIVGSPFDALKCFFQTDMDALCIGSFVISKNDQNCKTSDFFKSQQSAYGLD